MNCFGEVVIAVCPPGNASSSTTLSRLVTTAGWVFFGEFDPFYREATLRSLKAGVSVCFATTPSRLSMLPEDSFYRELARNVEITLVGWKRANKITRLAAEWV